MHCHGFFQRDRERFNQQTNWQIKLIKLSMPFSLSAFRWGINAEFSTCVDNSFTCLPGKSHTFLGDEKDSHVCNCNSHAEWRP